MDLLQTNPQIISAFSSLGFLKNEVYEISPDALVTLEKINSKLIYEDTTIRSFRRAIGFGQHVKADLIPLLINAKDPEIVDAVVRILVNLTVPVECLFCIDIMYRTELGRNTIFQINNLLFTSKEAFADTKSIKSVMNRIKTILDSESKKFSVEQCYSINNCLLLLRNILHIPEGCLTGFLNNTPSANNGQTSLQNTILWNLFIQSIDKTLLFLMACPQRADWVVTMVQLINLMFKDQRAATVQKLLSIWFEASLSESSEENESNTTPPIKGSCESSPMLTSSDSNSNSDNDDIGNKELSEDRRQNSNNKATEATLQEVSRKGQEYQQHTMMRMPKKKKEKKHKDPAKMEKKLTQMLKSFEQNSSEDTFVPPPPPPPAKSCDEKMDTTDKTNAKSNATKGPHSGILSNGKCPAQKRGCQSSTSELSDCGYGTQIDTRKSISISTSSNEDERAQQKPVHQKPPSNQKLRPNQHSNIAPIEIKECRRKKLVKRGKSIMINMKGMIHHTPTDEDISNLLKEFTVDFLLKGYDYMVPELHAQLLGDVKVPMDTSHFFWLITYFLQFASQLELDLEHVTSVLNYQVISYLVYEGAMICEQLELAWLHDDSNDMKSFLRRIHLVVTALREILHALANYQKISHLTPKDQQYLNEFKLQICATENLRSLFILLIRKLDPVSSNRQYLQDIILTNHDLLVLLDDVSRSKDTDLISFDVTEHIAQFAQVEIMRNYALLLDEFHENGEFVNDCIFTMMHHIGVDLEQVQLLVQPYVITPFRQILESGFEVCEDWSYLIKHVLHRYTNSLRNNRIAFQCGSLTELTKEHNLENDDCQWSQEEKDILHWYYVLSKKSKDVVGRIRQLYKEHGNNEKSRNSIIQQLLQQDAITLVEYDDLMLENEKKKIAKECEMTSETGCDLKEHYQSIPIYNTSLNMDSIQYLVYLLTKEGKLQEIKWLQNTLLECCYVKLKLDFENIEPAQCSEDDTEQQATQRIHVMEGVPYHCILKKKSIPLIPWNADQSNIMAHEAFIMLLDKLGFHLPVDACSIYARVPNFWTADMMYSAAEKLGSIDTGNLKFNTCLLHKSCKPEPEAEMEFKEQLNANINENLNSEFAVPLPPKHTTNSIIRSIPESLPTPSIPNWLQLVMKNKCGIQTSNNSCVSSSSSSSINYSSNSNPHIISSKILEAIAEIESYHGSIFDDEDDYGEENCMKEEVEQQQQNDDDRDVATDKTTDDITDKDIAETKAEIEIENELNMSQAFSENRTDTSSFIVSAKRQRNPSLKNQSSEDSFLLRSIDRDDSSGYQTRRGSQMDTEFNSIATSFINTEFLKNLNCTETDSLCSGLNRMYESDEDAAQKS